MRGSEKCNRAVWEPQNTWRKAWMTLSILAMTSTPLLVGGSTPRLWSPMTRTATQLLMSSEKRWKSKWAKIRIKHNQTQSFILGKKSGRLISSHVLTSKGLETVGGENSGGGSKAVQDAQDLLHLLHGHWVDWGGLLPRRWKSDNYCGLLRWKYRWLLQALGVAPLKSRLEAIGGWPLIDSGTWKDEEFVWYGCTLLYF